jgi:hypothetical protein
LLLDLWPLLVTDASPPTPEPTGGGGGKWMPVANVSVRGRTIAARLVRLETRATVSVLIGYRIVAGESRTVSVADTTVGYTAGRAARTGVKTGMELAVRGTATDELDGLSDVEFLTFAATMWWNR